MKLLFDENLSWRLVDRLAGLFPGSAHVGQRQSMQSPDASVWEHAKANDFTIVSADADFYELATTFGPPPKAIWLRRCDYPTAMAERLIRGQAIRVAEFLNHSDRGVLILTA